MNRAPSGSSDPSGAPLAMSATARCYATTRVHPPMDPLPPDAVVRAFGVRARPVPARRRRGRPVGYQLAIVVGDAIRCRRASPTDLLPECADIEGFDQLFVRAVSFR